MSKIYLVSYKYWIEDYYECEDILDIGFRTREDAVSHIEKAIMGDFKFREIYVPDDENIYLAAYRQRDGIVTNPEELDYDDKTFLDWYWQNEGSVFYFIREITVQ